jgi:hypothetical protein
MVKPNESDDALCTLAHQVEILTAERDALKVDADRYQWLRTQNAHLESSLTITLVYQTAEQPSDSIWVGSDLDAVVDNAIEYMKEPK